MVDNEEWVAPILLNADLPEDKITEDLVSRLKKVKDALEGPVTIGSSE
jgi:hypothetical protein